MAIQHLLFPTDFSSHSKNAITYGIQLANTVKATHITILHTYDTSSAFANEAIISVGLPKLLQEAQNDLDSLKEKVQSQVGKDTIVSVLLTEGKLIAVAHELIRSNNIDLLVMGISTKNKLEQTLIGSNTINVMRKTKCPVIVVPDNAAWTPQPNIAVAIDISHDFALLPIGQIKDFFNQVNGSKLELVNIEDNDDHNTHMQNPNIEKINFAFADAGTKLDILSSPNKLQAIESYCSNKHVSLLLLTERKYGILNTIFHKSLIRQIAFQTHVPILVIEEQNKE